MVMIKDFEKLIFHVVIALCNHAGIVISCVVFTRIHENFFCREFFHLLSLAFVNPDIALFESINGLYKPSTTSCANENHLFYFNFFGKILGKAVCDGKLELLSTLGGN